MEKIRVISNGSEKWDVLVGSQVRELHSRLNLEKDEQNRILDEAVNILSSCGNPSNVKNSETGLIIGYVQSGKTLSFTTVSALAVENGFNCIIILAGTTTKLVEQTSERLKRDLEIDSKSNISWKQFINPNYSKEVIEEMAGDLTESLYEETPVLLLSVMKNVAHLENLVQILGSSKITSLNLKCLIIDDEADQAGLNTLANKEGEEASAIYEKIRNIRTHLINHTYLQYTATPQAPLFISILDILSPNFVKILEPGKKYTGGKKFFQDISPNNTLIKNISESEIYSSSNTFTDPPDSLISAMIFYYITVAIGIIYKEHPKTHNRTMMVHPSHLTRIQKVYENWVDSIKTRFIEDLSCDESDLDRIDLEKKFELEFKNNFSAEIKEYPNFSQIKPLLLPIISNTPIILLNSKTNNSIDWKKNYSIILVGGQVLDRGFTVEGLNVTYMPRPIGVGNSDTIQQRCRFFGYKLDYIDLCRVYIPKESKQAYWDYVMHEEHMRKALKEFSNSEQSLKEIKRAFILSPSLNLTRKNVISSEIERYSLRGWKNINPNDLRMNFNSEIIEAFVTKLNYRHSPFSGESEIQRHLECKVENERILNFLMELSYENPNNSILVNHICSLIKIFENNDISEVLVLNMSSGRLRERKFDTNHTNLFQGSNQNTGYLGDRNAKFNESLTIQFHHLMDKNTKKIFWLIAFHIPNSLNLDVISFNES